MSQQPRRNSVANNDPRKRRWTPASDIIGVGIKPRRSGQPPPGVPSEYEMMSRVGNFTDQDPAICFTWEIKDDCKYFGTPEKRRIIIEELKDVCRVTKMKCMVLRGTPHGESVLYETRVGFHDHNGRWVPPQRTPQRVPCPWRLTVFLGRAFDDCLLEGHIFTRMVYKPSLATKVVQIRDRPGRERWDPNNLQSLEFWLTRGATDLNAQFTDAAPNGPRGGGYGGRGQGGGGYGRGGYDGGYDGGGPGDNRGRGNRDDENEGGGIIRDRHARPEEIAAALTGSNTTGGDTGLQQAQQQPQQQQTPPERPSEVIQEVYRATRNELRIVQSELRAFNLQLQDQRLSDFHRTLLRDDIIRHTNQAESLNQQLQEMEQRYPSLRPPGY
ncbi:hypothetical protein V8F20_007979 [Naviculisporaceae sp. PSN 640]